MQNGLGALYQAKGQFEKAEPLYREALSIYKDTRGEMNADYGFCLDNLAGLYRYRGQSEKAELLYGEAQGILKHVLGARHPDYAKSLHNLGTLYHAQGRSAKAGALYLEALHLIEAHLEETASSLSEPAQLSHIAVERVHLNDLLHLKGTDAAQVYAVAFRWRGAVTARQTFARAARSDQTKEVKQLLFDLNEVSQQLSALVNNPPRNGVNIPQRHAELSGQREELEKQLAGKSHEFAEYKAYLKLTPEDLQKSLPPDAALIDFLAFDNKIAAFVVSRDKIARVDLKGGKELADLVAAYRNELSLNRTRPVAGEEDASSLYKAVWEPLAPHVGKAKLVLICPDGPLCQLPFAALRGSDPNKYLLEETAIAVVPVPRMLPRLLGGEVAAAEAPSLLAIGDVNFNGDPAFGKTAGDAPLYATRAGGSQAWIPLPGTRKEVEAIAKLFRTAASRGVFLSLEGDAASEPTVRREMQKYRYLHFATHGFFAPPEPEQPNEARTTALMTDRPASLPIGASPHLRCGLVCAGANKPTADEDGVLTALEIMDLDLGGVELAVLSACETGLGQVMNGDGVLGLQRAFQVAGARTTVTTLWKVPDAVTAALMTRFYENRWTKKLPTLEALREAQLWLLNNGVEAGVQDGPARKGRRTPPLYWAAFALAGDWR